MGNFRSKRIAIVVGVYKHNGKIYLGCHFEKSIIPKRSNKISLCGGHVEKHETMKEGAVREAREEHGIILNCKQLAQVHEYKTDTTYYVYYMVDVKPNDYHNKHIVTHNEIVNDSVFFSDIISKFPSNSIIETNARSTFLIDIEVLRLNEYKKYVFEPTYNFLKNNFSVY